MAPCAGRVDLSTEASASPKGVWVCMTSKSGMSEKASAAWRDLLVPSSIPV
jgi:hypothetical protein